jgi:hypothetical protein
MQNQQVLSIVTILVIFQPNPPFPEQFPMSLFPEAGCGLPDDPVSGLGEVFHRMDPTFPDNGSS